MARCWGFGDLATPERITLTRTTWNIWVHSQISITLPDQYWSISGSKTDQQYHHQYLFNIKPTSGLRLSSLSTKPCSVLLNIIFSIKGLFFSISNPQGLILLFVRLPFVSSWPNCCGWCDTGFFNKDHQVYKAFLRAFPLNLECFLRHWLVVFYDLGPKLFHKNSVQGFSQTLEVFWRTRC